MSSSVVEQIAGLERERTRLEGRLAADDNWRALVSLQALNGSAPPDAGETEQRLRRALAANPYYSARIKIVEAITILRRLGDSMPPPAAKSAVNDLDTAPRMPGTVQPTAELGTRVGVPLLGDEPKPVREVQNFRALAQAELPVTVPAPAAPASELTRIRGISPELAARLAGLGTRRFDEIAAWTAADVRRVATVLDLGRRISKENWIEQAALLAKTEAPAPVPAPVEPPLAEPEAIAVPTPPPDIVEQTRAPEQRTATAEITLSPEPEPVKYPAPAPGPAANVETAAQAASEPVHPARPADTTSPREWLAQRRVGWTLPSSARVADPMPVVPPPIPVTRPVEAAAQPPLTEFPGPAERAGLGEAEVVITGRAKTNDTAQLEASTLRSLRKRLLGMTKAAGIDATSHAGYLDNVEEASVEIVRDGSEGVKLPANGTRPPALPAARQTGTAGLISRFLQTLKGRK